MKLGTDASTRSAAASSSRSTTTAAAKGDPLYGVRMILRCGRERLTDKQKARLARAIAADERHDEVHVACRPHTNSATPTSPRT